jgi:hypothetical protein
MRRFPIHPYDDTPNRPDSIPWEVIAKHARQAELNHRQTLERLAARGGLSVLEAIAALEDRSLVPWIRMTPEEALTRLKKLTGE